MEKIIAGHPRPWDDCDGEEDLIAPLWYCSKPLPLFNVHYDVASIPKGMEFAIKHSNFAFIRLIKTVSSDCPLMASKQNGKQLFHN